MRSSQGVGRVLQPVHPLAQAALHLEDVGDRVDRPQVVRVGLDGPAPEFLGPRVLAAFLQAEGVHALNAAVAGHRLVPLVDDPGDAVADVLRPAHPEGVVVLEAQRQQVVGVFAEDFVPHGAGRRQVPARPGAERRHVGGFPARDLAGAGFAAARLAAILGSTAVVPNRLKR